MIDSTRRPLGLRCGTLLGCAMFLACGPGPATEPDGGPGTDGGGADGGSGSDGGAETRRLSGAVQKGPFIVGATVTVAPLDASGEPTGAVFTTATIDDLGSFSLGAPLAGPVRIEANGGYYNEVTGELSTGSLTLRAYHVVTGDETVYVNLVTHLTFARVQTLVAGGAAIADAVTQAEAELRAALEIVPPTLALTSRGVEMTITGGDTDENAYLLAVSTLLAQAAVERTPASPDTGLQELANMIVNDLEPDGTISAPLRGFLDAGLAAIDTSAVESALRARLALLGSSAVVPDLDRVLDPDRDGLASLSDNCPWVANADQADADGDGYGDACADCVALGLRCARSCATGVAGECRAGETCVSGTFTEMPMTRGNVAGAVCATACDPMVGCRDGFRCELFGDAGGGPGFFCVPLIADPLPGGDFEHECDVEVTVAACPDGEFCSPIGACVQWCDLAAGDAQCAGIEIRGTPTICSLTSEYGGIAEYASSHGAAAEDVPAGAGGCLPERRCDADVFLDCAGDATLVRCDSDGLGETTETCPAAELCDTRARACVPRCTDGDRRCVDWTEVQVCAGERWTTESTCASGQGCAIGAACRAYECSYPTFACLDADTRRVCIQGSSFSGFWQDVDCPLESPSCVGDGDCVAP